MTNTMAKPKAEPVISQTQGDTKDITGTAQYLGPCVLDLQTLVIDGKQAHWHVRGENFIAVHKLLDSVVKHAQAFADLAAERIVSMGLPIDARLSTIASKKTLPEMKPGFQNWGPMVQQVVAQIDATLVTVRAAVEGLDDIDLSSQDVAIEIERGLVEDRWFLSAHLATD